MPSIARVIAIAAVTGLVTCVAAPADASALAPPDVYVRQAQVGDPAPWQRLPAQVSSLGPYEIGVGIQPTSDPHNDQAVQVDLLSMPGGAAPSEWQAYESLSYCEFVTDSDGAIGSTGARLFFHGDGVYRLNVSVYTDAQWRSRSGNTCSGGPTTTVTVTVNATGGIKVVGNPIVPRTTLPKPGGFVGIELTAPEGAAGDRWRCAGDPIRSSDGPVTGSAVTSSTSDEAANVDLRRDETTAFTGPGPWACSVQLLAPVPVGDPMFGTPWTTTPTFIVHGQYKRNPLRASVTRLSHGRLKMSVPTAGQIGARAAGGRLTVTLYRASCRRRRIVLHRALRLSSVVDRKGVARFTFRRPVRQGFYLGRPVFGGNSVILAGRDTDMTLLEQGGTPYSPPAFGFIEAQAWQPCLV